MARLNDTTTVQKALCPFCLDADVEGDPVTREALQANIATYPAAVTITIIYTSH